VSLSSNFDAPRFCQLLSPQSKAMESTFLDRLGYWNSGAFKNLLKEFIVETDIGLPHPWEGARLDEQGVA